MKVPGRDRHTSDDTLYDRLGGEAAIDLVVDEFYDRVLADDSLAPYFEDTDTEALREHQKEFISFVTGGAEEYDDPDMATADADLGITDEAFVRVAEHLDASLRACDVADEDREELMGAVAGLQDAVVSA
jgi:hemoglobin